MPITQMTTTQVLREYFFKGKPAAEVITELKKLSPEEKMELAVGAAKELGVELKAQVKVE